VPARCIGIARAAVMGASAVRLRPERRSAIGPRRAGPRAHRLQARTVAESAPPLSDRFDAC
jgi:hypothetical protein